MAYIQRWLQTNTQEEFTARIYFTVREMYTVIKAHLPGRSTVQEELNWKKAELEKAPRFDKLILQYKANKAQEGPPLLNQSGMFTQGNYR